MKAVRLILLAVFVLFAEEQKAKLDLSVKPAETAADSSAAAKPAHLNRVYDYRYQVAGGVGMMLFFGLMLGLTESLNPR